MNYTIDQVMSILATVKDPESGKDLVSLNAVTSLQIEENKISFKLNLPSSNPFVKSIEKATIKLIKEKTSESVDVEIQAPTKIETKKISLGRVDDQQVLPGVKNILAVASGKGGVGKSTVSVNLAVALAKTGAKVGLLDADVYGPSIPKMMGVEKERPTIKKINGKDTIMPIEAMGVKMLSIGFFVNPEDALIWRGAMATNALNQFIKDTEWGDLDYFIIDLPPGTGDIHLTIVQTLPVTAAVIVSTPQDVAIADALRGVTMLPNNKYYIFGKDGVGKLGKELGIPLLGQIPLVQSIREGGDAGTPAVGMADKTVSEAFDNLAKSVAIKIEERNQNLEPTKKVEIDPNAQKKQNTQKE